MSERQPNQVKATITTSSSNETKVEKTFAMDVTKAADNGSHLSSLRNCVNRLQTQLNQYLTQIIDEENGNNSNANHSNDEESKGRAEEEELSEDRDTTDEHQREEPRKKKCKNK